MLKENDHIGNTREALYGRFLSSESSKSFFFPAEKQKILLRFLKTSGTGLCQGMFLRILIRV
jgi:hypothetical protein